MLANACCRCVFPFFGRPSFPAPKLTDEDKHEEEQHLLQDVLDSDDEQADTLTSEEIKRYLAESRSKSRSSEMESSKRIDGGLRQRSGRDARQDSPSSSPDGDRGGGMPKEHALREVDEATSSRRAAGELFDPEEEDDLFDEEEEPENVVVGAKPAKESAAMRNGASALSSRLAVSMRPVQSLMDAELAEVEGGGGKLDFLPPGEDAPRVSELISMNDWIDMDEQEPRELSVSTPSWLTAGSDGGTGGCLSQSSLQSLTIEHAAEDRDAASSRVAAQTALEVLNLTSSRSFTAPFPPTVDRPFMSAHSSAGDKLSISSVSTGISEMGTVGSTFGSIATGGSPIVTTGGGLGTGEEDGVEDDMLPMTAFGGAFATLNLQQGSTAAPGTTAQGMLPGAGTSA